MTRLSFDEAVGALRSGAIVALPTDTVYGVGAGLEFPEAVEGLFALKRRSAAVALPVVAADADAVARLVERWPRAAARAAAEFWPGALTIVVEARGPLGALVHSASSRVGFRVPGDELLAAVLAATGPLALTSANEHGSAPCVTADDVLVAFAGRDELAGVLDAGRRDSPVSTVVEFDDDGWRVVREGAVSVSRLSAALD